MTQLLPWHPTDVTEQGRMIMPRLRFEEPLGGPLAKAAREDAEKNAQEPAQQVEDTEPDQPVEEPTEHLSALFVEEEEDEREGRHRREPEQGDSVLVVLKTVTVAAGLALVGLVILLTTSGGAEPSAKPPSVPDIPASDRPAAPATTTTDFGAIVAPPVHSQTTEMAPPSTSAQRTISIVASPGPNQFVRAGDPCDTPGAVAVTERYEPVMCGGGRHNDRLVWRRVFR